MITVPKEAFNYFTIGQTDVSQFKITLTIKKMYLDLKLIDSKFKVEGITKGCFVLNKPSAWSISPYSKTSDFIYSDDDEQEYAFSSLKNCEKFIEEYLPHVKEIYDPASCLHDYLSELWNAFYIIDGGFLYDIEDHEKLEINTEYLKKVYNYLKSNLTRFYLNRLIVRQMGEKYTCELVNNPVPHFLTDKFLIDEKEIFDFLINPSTGNIYFESKLSCANQIASILGKDIQLYVLDKENNIDKLENVDLSNVGEFNLLTNIGVVDILSTYCTAINLDTKLINGISKLRSDYFISLLFDKWFESHNLLINSFK